MSNIQLTDEVIIYTLFGNSISDIKDTLPVVKLYSDGITVADYIIRNSLKDHSTQQVLSQCSKYRQQEMYEKVLNDIFAIDRCRRNIKTQSRCDYNDQTTV